MRYFTFCFLFSWPAEGDHFQLVFGQKRFSVISYSFLRLGCTPVAQVYGLSGCVGLLVAAGCLDVSDPLARIRQLVPDAPARTRRKKGCTPGDTAFSQL